MKYLSLKCFSIILYIHVCNLFHFSSNLRSGIKFFQPLSEIFFISILKNIFTHRLCSIDSFSSPLKICSIAFRFLLFWWKVSNYSHVYSPGFGVSFPLAAVSIFLYLISISLVFGSCTIMCLNMIFCLFILYGMQWTFWISTFIFFIKHRKCFMQWWEKWLILSLFKRKKSLESIIILLCLRWNLW